MKQKTKSIRQHLDFAYSYQAYLLFTPLEDPAFYNGVYPPTQKATDFNPWMNT